MVWSGPMPALTKRASFFFNPVRLAGWSAVGLILLTPLAAMQVTSEVAWDAQDFLFAAILLIGAGLLLELVLWKARTPLMRLMLAASVILAVLLIWAEAAVGIF